MGKGKCQCITSGKMRKKKYSQTNRFLLRSWIFPEGYPLSGMSPGSALSTPRLKSQSTYNSRPEQSGLLQPSEDRSDRLPAVIGCLSTRTIGILKV
jgi:hypothetical protein